MGLGDIGGLSDEYIVTLTARTKEAHKDMKDFFRSVSEGSEEAGASMDEGINKRMFLIGTAAEFAGGLALKAFDIIIQGARQAASAIARMTARFIAGGLEINATTQSLMIAFTNITGSQEAAADLLDYIRERSALLGQDWTKMATLARGLVPFAQGDVQVFEQMLTLAQQLAVLDPTAGVRGAGRALREALSGNVRSLAGIFELPLSELNEYKRAFQETGDIDAFINNISNLVGAFGSAAGDIEALADTAKGTINRMKFEFMDLQRILTAPLFAVAQEQLQKFAEIVDNNSAQLKESALAVGAVIAVLAEMAIEALTLVLNVIVVNINAGLTAYNTVAEIVRVGLDAVEQLAVGVIVNTVKVAVKALNTIIQEANKIAEALGLPVIDEVIVDFERLERTARSTFKNLTAPAQVLTEPIEALGDALQELFPDFEGRVQAYKDQFADLLDVNKDGITDIGGQTREFEEESLEDTIEYLRDVRDALEKHHKDVQKAEEKHQEKLISIDERAAERRADVIKRNEKRRRDVIRDFEKGVEDAQEDLAKSLAEIDESITEDRLEIEKNAVDQIEEIEKNHAETLRRIRKGVQRQLFDAVNARDARRVFDILQKSREDVSEAERGRRKRIAELRNETGERLKELEVRRAKERQKAEQAFAEEIVDLHERREERLAALRESLAEELQEIEENRIKQRNKEIEAHRKRMIDLNNQIRERLFMIGRGWAEQGNLTAQGLSGVMGMVESVFGPNGAYIGLIQGFNSALIMEVANTNAILSGIATQGPSGIGSVSGGGHIPAVGGTSRSKTGSSSTSIGAKTIPIDLGMLRAQHGFDGIVRSPTIFLTGEGNIPEKVSVIPKGKEGFSSSSDGEGFDGGSNAINIHVTADSNFSREFEASLSQKIANLVGNSVLGRRRSRRS
jgi:hypothetical protein